MWNWSFWNTAKKEGVGNQDDKKGLNKNTEKEQRCPPLLCTFQPIAADSRFFPNPITSDHIKTATKFELKEVLQGLINEHNSKSSRFHQDVKFTFARNQATDQFPDFVYKVLRDFINRNPNIKTVDLSYTSFNQRQIDELEALAQKNALNSQKRFSTLRSLFFMGSMGGFLNATNGLINVAQMIGSLPIIAAKTLFEGVVLSGVSFLRQWYLDSSAKKYDRKSDLSNERELEALQLGVKSATSWIEYFKSFGNYVAYLFPRAFAGAMQHALDQNDDVVDHIMKRTKHWHKENALKITLTQQRSLIPYLTKPTIISRWIAFDDVADFERQLQRLLQDYQGNVSFLNKTATITLEHDPASNATPDYVLKALSTALIRSGVVRTIEDPSSAVFKAEDFLPISLEIQRRAQLERRRLLATVSLTLAGSLLVTSALPVLLINAVVVGLGTKLYSSWRQQFLDYAADNYQEKSQFTETEHQAMLSGINSDSWKGYLSSFNLFDKKNAAALRHPVAYSAALEYVLENNTSMQEKILNRPTKG